MQHVKRRKSLLAKTKGMMWRRKSSIRQARPAELKAGAYAYRDRRNKKRNFRRLWQIRLNAALRPLNTNYSRFINDLKKAEVVLDRKILSTIAKDHPEVFKKIVEAVKSR